MCVGTWIREHVGTQNTLEHEPVIMQYTLTREHISAWGTWVREQKIKKGTVASEHNVSTQDTQFSRLTVCKQQDWLPNNKINIYFWEDKNKAILFGNILNLKNLLSKILTETDIIIE